MSVLSTNIAKCVNYFGKMKYNIICQQGKMYLTGKTKCHIDEHKNLYLLEKRKCMICQAFDVHQLIMHL